MKKRPFTSIAIYKSWDEGNAGKPLDRGRAKWRQSILPLRSFSRPGYCISILYRMNIIMIFWLWPWCRFLGAEHFSTSISFLKTESMANIYNSQLVTSHALLLPVSAHLWQLDLGCLFPLSPNPREPFTCPRGTRTPCPGTRSCWLSWNRNLESCDISSGSRHNSTSGSETAPKSFLDS